MTILSTDQSKALDYLIDWYEGLNVKVVHCNGATDCPKYPHTHGYGVAPVKSLGGLAGCVAGETELWDPILMKGVRFDELHSQSRRPWVQTLAGPVMAEVPFVKGIADLYRITMLDGRSSLVTADHLLMKPKDEGEGMRKIITTAALLAVMSFGLTGCADDEDTECEGMAPVAMSVADGRSSGGSGGGSRSSSSGGSTTGGSSSTGGAGKGDKNKGTTSAGAGVAAAAGVGLGRHDDDDDDCDDD